MGWTRPIRADLRFVAATNRDLAEAVRTGRFRPEPGARPRAAGWATRHLAHDNHRTVVDSKHPLAGG